MRRTAATALLIAALAACFGAGLATRRGQAPATGQQPVYAQEPIDRSEPLPLEPVRAPADFGEQSMAHVRNVVSFGPRNPGRSAAPGWSKQLDYIEATLRSLGLEVVRDTWTDRKELITFSNVVATIPGRRQERIVLGCHHDTKCTQGHPNRANNFHFVGANDGGSGVGALLALAPVLLRRDNEATIQLVFFDGEESLDWSWNDGARALFGSKRFVQRHRERELVGEAPRIAAMVLLDMVGRTDLHIQEELYSTRRLREILWGAAVATGHQRSFFQRAEAASDDHKPFLDVGIPAVDLIDLNGNPHWHKPSDTVENMAASSIQKVGDVVLTMLPRIEQEYVVAGQ